MLILISINCHSIYRLDWLPSRLIMLILTMVQLIIVILTTLILTMIVIDHHPN